MTVSADLLDALIRKWEAWGADLDPVLDDLGDLASAGVYRACAVELRAAAEALRGQAAAEAEEKLRLHRARPEATIPAEYGVTLPLPTGPERLTQIEDRLHAAVMLPLGTGETGWQVYVQGTVSTGKMEKLLAKRHPGEGRTYTPPVEYTIHTAYDHGQLKAPGPIVSRMCGPYHYPNDLSSLRPEHAQFIAHAPADIAYLLERLAALAQAEAGPREGT